MHTNKDYSYDYTWDERYCYPQSNVLKNKLGIVDAEKLYIAERELTSLRMANAKMNPIAGDFELRHLVGASAKEIPIRLAYYLSEINVLHPFREENGRAQRMFIEYLAEKNDFMVDFSLVTDVEMIEASTLAFECDYKK